MIYDVCQSTPKVSWMDTSFAAGTSMCLIALDSVRPVFTLRFVSEANAMIIQVTIKMKDLGSLSERRRSDLFSLGWNIERVQVCVSSGVESVQIVKDYGSQEHPLSVHSMS